MRRIALAAALAAFGLVGVAAANDGPGTFGMGCRGYALRLFPGIHQHGPLYNYGPYYGYPPFEPYGDWNSYLQYTGPIPEANGHHGAGGQGAYGWIHGPSQHTFGGGFPHPFHNGGGIRHRSHGSSGCNSCGHAAEQVVNSGNALERYTGIGTAAASHAYYADGPTLITVGYTGR